MAEIPLPSLVKQESTYSHRIRLFPVLLDLRSSCCLRCLLALIVFILIIIATGLRFYKTEKTSTAGSISQKKLILLWTTWFDIPFSAIWGDGHVLRERCNLDCELSSDRSRIHEADAVVFHIPALVPVYNVFHAYDVPSYRSPHQRYVFYTIEPPANNFVKLSKFSNFFNWTMTYRRDSDIYSPYGFFRPVNSSSPTGMAVYNASFKPLEKKTGWIAWVVSRCHSISRREEYVRLLGRHIPVDIWGRCARRPCDGDCFAHIANNYRFYISMENSFCTDYVSEKFFSRLGELGAIPIVLQAAKNTSGTKRDNYLSTAPPNSYIDASNFGSPKELADYLRKVGTDPALFSAYENWRGLWTMEANNLQPSCDLCKKLQDDTRPKIYEDIKEWWVGGAKRNADGTLDESRLHCQPGVSFSKRGQTFFRPYLSSYLQFGQLGIDWSF